MTNYLMRLKRWRERNKMPPLKYVAVTERKDKILHHHIIVNKMDMEKAIAGRTRTATSGEPLKWLQTMFILEIPKRKHPAAEVMVEHTQEQTAAFIVTIPLQMLHQACRQWKDLLQQLIDSKAWVDINQGLDIRLMTEEKAEMLKRIKIKQWHFAWDRYKDKELIVPKFNMFKEITNINERNLIVYALCNYDTTLEQDLERIYTLREMGYWAYVMLYDKEHIPSGHILKKLARWVNNRFIFAKCERFEDYLNGSDK